ncbi:MAG TPA: lamin tail domain-containing protein [Kofleriaceae bacterium]
MPRLLLLILTIGSISCITTDEAGDSNELGGTAVVVPPRGEPGTLDVGEWNVEWFGSTTEGPANETLQLANVRDVIVGSDLDLWALSEVVSKSHFDQLVAQLPGYQGFLANDPSVTSGSSFYSVREQKVGILFKSDVIEVQSARLVATAESYQFGGRPPLEVELTATIGETSMSFVLIVLHAKAMGDSASYTRRLRGSIALAEFLDGTRATDRVVIAGDFNDDVDTSIRSGQPSPYQNFVDDAAAYVFPTKVLSDTGQRTTIHGSQAIDHHLITNELVPFHIAGSAAVYRVDEFVPSYGDTTSDHFPTLTRYRLGGPTGEAHVIINEILANEPGTQTAGEFVEIVNAGATAADLSGCTVSDAAGVRHVFAPGTALAPGKAVVVSGSTASTGSLSLNNTGDTVTVACVGVPLDSFTYTTALTMADAVSMNRDPDADAIGSFVLHTELAASSSSPGKRANGSSF